MPDGSTAPSHLRVPLPDGTSAPIPTLRNEETFLMLGVHWSPSLGGSKHVNEMAKKGYNWADCMKSCPLPHDLAWKSFNLQLQPGLNMGNHNRGNASPETLSAVSMSTLQVPSKSKR
jgi:hypothetical protein